MTPATSYRLSPMARARIEMLARAIGTSRTRALEWWILSMDPVLLSEGIAPPNHHRSSRHHLIRDALVLMRIAAAMLREQALQDNSVDLTTTLTKLIQRALTLVEEAAGTDAGPEASCIDCWIAAPGDTP